MKLNPLFILLATCIFSAASAEVDEARYNKPFIPGVGDKVLLSREFIIGPEKVFLTFSTQKKLWDSLPLVDLSNAASFSFSHEDALQRALSFHGDNPPATDTSTKVPIRTELISIERITVIESQEDLNANRGKYYYYVHFRKTYPPPDVSLPEQPVDSRIIVLPTGWAAFPFYQFMKINAE